ncbi:DNA cytosine methyltransferase [Alteromonas naphthalenivorans]|nr:DNA cytosine methyltransferase [Alteromonas naphthalenivorans]
MNSPNYFYEFFAGGGMARAGLDSGWKCLFANDFDYKKVNTYKKNWGNETIVQSDIKTLQCSDLKGAADLVWASFPCQDLSLAGGGAGLRGERSGTFWPFWDLMKSLVKEKRPPKIIALENVCGALTSHDGSDFSAICSALSESDYSFGALVVDAALFLPHSRPRLFIIAVHKDCEIPDNLTLSHSQKSFHTKQLIKAHDLLSEREKSNWIWWSVPLPTINVSKFIDIIEEDSKVDKWDSPEKTSELLQMMSDVNLQKVEDAKRSGIRKVGTLYKRTRKDSEGNKVQRSEVRFDDIAGCLRTPSGGSSRQSILIVEGENIRSRLISIRETARLMGLPDSYVLPENYNEGYHLTGDGVAVPVVRHLANALFEKILSFNKLNRMDAA